MKFHTSLILIFIGIISVGLFTTGEIKVNPKMLSAIHSPIEITHADSNKSISSNGSYIKYDLSSIPQNYNITTYGSDGYHYKSYYFIKNMTYGGGGGGYITVIKNTTSASLVIDDDGIIITNNTIHCESGTYIYSPNKHTLSCSN